ncbi:YbgC/FadM family acyl-CoA thioesterase [Oleisolibacter albus]|uniref:YbgC/FadM family acyl-CoA thioesterase n=1 Tax=Oleisolibacter albus TaxID=2171757 RepID=UPI000DF2096A|nr:YbgC/FadM family acyl-CoA thioesterase [Oleisolibacter albus]
MSPDPLSCPPLASSAPPLGRLVGGGAHLYPLRVYYEDTDAGGIVYHANYLRFCERARTEMMRLVGYPHSTMIDEAGVAFAVRRCEIDFLQPARLDDALEVVTVISDIGGATLDVLQTVRRPAPGRPDADRGIAPGQEIPPVPGEDVTDLARLTLRLACINHMGRPARLPKPLRAVLQAFVARYSQD